MQKKDIRSLTLEELKDFFGSRGEQLFRAQQVYEWLWKKFVRSIDDMTNLSKQTRLLLHEHYVLNSISVADQQRSKDGTIKSAFRLYDGNIVEGVLIPAPSPEHYVAGTAHSQEGDEQWGRMTACISSQIGCSLDCRFCATGKLGRIRNLNADEMFDQVAIIRQQAEKEYGVPLSNIVYMGMGEPLLNYTNVLESVEMITSPDKMGVSPRRITLSTAGIAKMIKRLGGDAVRFNLALSLHAANDEKRSQIMPINESNSLEVLAEALRYFYEKTGSRVTYEYIIFNNFNDDIPDAIELARFCRNVPCKVNIIEYNPIDGGEFQKAKRPGVDAFVQFLESKNIIVNIRKSRGKDIDAACGQLANKNKATGENKLIEVKLSTGVHSNSN